MCVCVSTSSITEINSVNFNNNNQRKKHLIETTAAAIMNNKKKYKILGRVCSVFRILDFEIADSTIAARSAGTPG